MQTEGEKTVVVGVADTATARAGVEEAAELARLLSARLHLVMAVKNPRTETVKAGSERWTVSDLDKSHLLLDEVSREVGLDDVTTRILEGEPAKALVAEAERLDADLIVVGNKRMQGLARVLGAVAKDVATHAPCAVYIAHTTSAAEHSSHEE